MAKIGGVIGVPSLGMVSTHFLGARAMLQGDLGLSWVDKIVLDEEMRSLGKPTDVGSKKQYIAEYAIEQGADWVLYIDDDVIFPPNTLIKLLHRNKDIVGGVYWSKSEPPVPLIFKGHMQGTYRDWHAGDFIKVDAMGMGLTLIRTKVFKAMEKPWFTLDYTYQEAENRTTKDYGTTEDLYFYKKARDHGFEVWCDTSLQAWHYEKNTKQMFGIQNDFPQAIAGSDLKPRGKKLIADIGSGEHSPYFPEGIPVRMDIREEVKPDIVCDVRSIPEPDEKYDIVFSSHTLEHFSHKVVDVVLREWTRILKIGGELRLILPNLEFACDSIIKSKGEIDYNAINILYGEQTYPKNFHACGFTQKTLARLLEKMGCLKDILVVFDGPKYNLLASAVKYKKTRLFESIHPSYSLKGGMHRIAPLQKADEHSMEEVMFKQNDVLRKRGKGNLQLSDKRHKRAGKKNKDKVKRHKTHSSTSSTSNITL